MRDAHATLFLDAAAAARVEPLRQRWDPVMADQIAAHLTVTYPTEIPSAPTLRERLEAATERVGPFRLRLGEVRSFGEPEQGLFAEVVDVDGGWLALREAVGFTSKRLEVTPHVTLVHPRTSKRGLEAWTVLQGTDLDVGVAVGQAAITAFNGRAWRTDATFPLIGPPS
jgi:2'-5' RNA ligase